MNEQGAEEQVPKDFFSFLTRALLAVLFMRKLIDWKQG